MTLSNTLSIGAHKHAEAGEEEVRVALLLVDPWLLKNIIGSCQKELPIFSRGHRRLLSSFALFS